MILTGGNLSRSSGIFTGGRLSRAAVAAGGSPSYTPGVASYAGTTTRNDLANILVGFKFTIASGITIHSLGRRKLSGNTGAHRVGLWDAATGLFLAGGKADLSTGAAGADVLTALVGDLALPAGSYYLMSREFSASGDVWLDSAAATMATGITLANRAYCLGGTALGRNDFTGRVGFKFTPTGGQSITHVGRYKVEPADSTSHTVYLADAATGTTLGSAVINLSGAPTGMVYAALSSPVAVSGGTSYFLASDETSGGELWFDVSTGTLAAGFTLNNSAFYSGGSYTVDQAGKMFPVGFKFGSGQPGLASFDPVIQIENAGVMFSSAQFEFY